MKKLIGLIFAGVFVLYANAAQAQSCNTSSGWLKTFGTIPLGNALALGPDCNSVQDGGPAGSTNLHLVVYTVAPSGASATDKSRADFVGDGVNDQVAVASALANAGTGNSSVVMLPGVYFFSSTANINFANNFLFEARGTIVFGPTLAQDTFKVLNPAGGSTINIGSVVTRTSDNNTSAIHIVGDVAQTNNGATNFNLTYATLTGLNHGGIGLRYDAILGGVVASTVSGQWIHGFNRCISAEAQGSSTTWIDTMVTTVGFAFDCNTDVFGRSGSNRRNNSNIWNINVDAYINGAIAIDIDHSMDVFNVIWGEAAPNAATAKLLVLQSGAFYNQFNGTPNIQISFPNQITDNSGNTTNTINGSSIDATLNGLGQLVKYSATINGEFERTGLSLGTIGAVNTLSWFSSIGVWSSLATANSSVLTTSAGGVPSWATTLPSGLTLPGPTVTGSFTATGLVKLTDHATQANNTIIANNSGSPASPSALTGGQVGGILCPPVVNTPVVAAGSGTYTTPTCNGITAKYVDVELVGPGGGGAGSGTAPGNGGAGSAATTFGTALLSAGAGGGGTNSLGGSPGAVTGGDINMPSAAGGNPTGASSQSGGQGTPAPMYSVFAPLSGVANIGLPGAGCGAGGSGAGDGATASTGGGGAGGGYLRKRLFSPSATYNFVVSTGGAQGTAGASGFHGGAGTDGCMFVIAYFQ